jgi:tetratricopeptide (TPR) repeat protein
MNESRHAGFASPYVNMSALSNRTGDRAAALDYARRALQANPNSDRALFQMAKAHEYEGDLNAAAEELNRAIAINSHSSSYFYVLSTMCLTRENENADRIPRFLRRFADRPSQRQRLSRRNAPKPRHSWEVAVNQKHGVRSRIEFGSANRIRTLTLLVDSYVFETCALHAGE